MATDNRKPPNNPNDSGFRKNKPLGPSDTKKNPRLPGTQVQDVSAQGSASKIPNYSDAKNPNPQKDSEKSAFNEGAKAKKSAGSLLEESLSRLEGSPIKRDLPKNDGQPDPSIESTAWGTNNRVSAGDLKLDKENALRVQYRIPKKLAALYEDNPKKLKDLSDWFFKQLISADQDRLEFFDNRLPKFRNTVLNFVTAGLQEVFEGSHNIHVPLAFEKCKAMHARIYQAIFGLDPMFSLKPRTNVAAARKEAKEQLLNFILKNYINNRQGIYSVIDQDIWNFVADGTSITRHSWSKDVRKFVTTEFEINEQGEEREKEVETEEVLFDGPCLETRPIENIYLIGDKYDDADSLDILADRQRYTKSDLVKKTKLGFFHADTVEHILNTVTPTTFQRSDLHQTEVYSFLKEVTTGMQQEHKMSGIKAYDIYEVYARYDIDDDGIDEELVFWVEGHSKCIIRITYLERVGPAGKRPYVIKRFFPREGTPYAIGLGEMLFGLNNEIDYIHNMRLDSAVFQVLPFFIYRKTSSVGDQKIKMQVRPGQGIGVEDTSDIVFPKPATNLNFTYNEEQNIRSISDSVSSISPLSMGQVAGQGATRTATGTAALVAAADALIDISIKRYQQGFKKNLEIIDKQVTDLLPLGTAVRILGVDGREVYKIFNNRDALRFDADFELEANSTNSNKAIERELAATTFQNSLNPILIQTGVVGPEQIKNSYVRYLKSLEVKNIHDYVANFDEGASIPSRSGKDELTMILFGVKPEVRLNDRHQEKLALFEEFERSPDFGLFDTPEQIQMYYETKKAHQDALSAIAAQASQAAQSGIVAPLESAGIAAGAGNPTGGVAQQQSDLAGSAFGAQ